VGDPVSLDGSGSTDGDVPVQALTYSWVIVSAPAGSTATLSGADTASPSFTPDVAGDYVIELVVNDGVADSVPDSVTVVATVVSELEVEIDIMPNSGVNAINLRARGVIPVAILTTDDFDATEIDPLTVVFGPAGASEKHGKGHYKDVDGDGDIDLLLHFRIGETGIAAGDTEACLTGSTFAGQDVFGCDAIRIVRQ